jgi:nitroreductase
MRRHAPDITSDHYGGQLVDLDLLTTLRSTGAVREFRDQPVPNEVLTRLLETARFAPSGGNRQGWRVIVVKDPAARTALRDLYLSGWYDYLALVSAGMTAWSPLSDRQEEAAALANAGQFAAAGAAAPGFAEKLDTAPALLLVLADLGALATVDRDLPRYTLAPPSTPSSGACCSPRAPRASPG